MVPSDVVDGASLDAQFRTESKGELSTWLRRKQRRLVARVVARPRRPVAAASVAPRRLEARAHFAVNKSQLVDHVAQELRTSRLGASRLVDTVLTGIQKGLREEQCVTIAGFGTFEVKARKARIGRNPHTGEPIRIAAGRRVGFRMGKTLRESV